MFGVRRRCAFLFLAGAVFISPLPVLADSPSSLAGYVPADARLFLEIRDMRGLAETPLGVAVGDMLADWFKPPEPSRQSQPAGNRPNTDILWWRRLFAEAVGLNNHRAVDLLFNGRLGLAADGWSGLGDAVLLVAPADPAALEIELGEFRESASAGKAVRSYQLARDHELLSNGQVVAVGRRTNRAGLLMRTMELWEQGGAASLGNLPEFRERTSALPAGAQLVFYSATESTVPSSLPLVGKWWSTAWSQRATTAVGVLATAGGVVVGTSSRLAPENSDLLPCDPPLHLLLLLPDSTVAAWTRPIDYLQEFRRLDSSHSDDIVRGYLDVLRSGLSSELLEDRLFKHLVGDTIFFIGGVKRELPGSQEAQSKLLLPAMAVMVETDDPYAVELMLRQVMLNLLSALNTPSGQSAPDGGISAVTAPFGGTEGGVLYSIDLSSLFASSQCEFLRSLEISWSVVDRWLVLGTDRGTVREIILARRGQAPVMSAAWIKEALPQSSLETSSLETVLIAQPGKAGAMIGSWINYISSRHPEMIKPGWWYRLRRKQRASSIQLGILPRLEGLSPGQVEVLETMPNYPAHNRLRAGDHILAVDGQSLNQADPLKSLRELLAMRERADGVRLLIIRAGKQQEIEIEMPAGYSAMERIQPVNLLRRLAGALRLLSSVSYVSWRQPPDVIESRLELKLVSGHVAD